MEVVRFAPSPTGWLHLGHAYSANYADRARAGGKFLLRIEDIDLARAKAEFYDGIFQDLRWLGVRWEDPALYQSRRMAAYQAAMARLISDSSAYRCFCSRKEVASATQAPHESPPEYPGTCRSIPLDEADAMVTSGRSFAWRLDVGKALRQAKNLSWIDRRLGTQAVPLIGDPVIARKDIPTSYHLSCVVDDAEQGVTLVTRGEDLFEATHIHRLLQSVLDLPTPHYEHHSLVGDDEGKRLSKRDHSITLRSLRAKGWTPDQILARAEDCLIGS